MISSQDILEEQIVCAYPDLINNVICKICFMLLKRPILVCNNCNYFACGECINKWKETSKHLCPQKCSNDAKFIKKSIPNLEMVLKIIEIKCPYSMNPQPFPQCTEKFQYSDEGMTNHFQTCQLEVVKCTMESCLEKIVKRDKLQHEMQCPFNQKKCLYCKTNFHETKIQEHQLICSYRDVPCPCLGCTEKIKIIDMAEHKRKCPFRLKQCILCDKKMAGNQIDIHKKECPKIETPCLHCMNKIVRCQMEKHLEDCQKVPWKCEDCDCQLRKENQKDHNEIECIQYLSKRLSNLEDEKQKCQKEIMDLKNKIFV